MYLRTPDTLPVRSRPDRRLSCLSGPTERSLARSTSIATESMPSARTIELFLRNAPKFLGSLSKSKGASFAKRVLHSILRNIRSRHFNGTAAGLHLYRIGLAGAGVLLVSGGAFA